jgi:urea-proton symporter
MTIQADAQYMGMTSSFGGTPPLNIGAGYGVVLGFGVFFSLFASFATFLDNRYAGTVETR